MILEEKIESSFLSKENSIDIITKDAFRTADKDNKGYIDINEFDDRLSLWQGDVTLVKCDAIVNLSNNKFIILFI